MDGGTSAEDRKGKVKATFKLEIVGRVQPRTRLFGHIVRGMMVEASAEVELGA